MAVIWELRKLTTGLLDDNDYGSKRKFQRIEYCEKMKAFSCRSVF